MVVVTLTPLQIMKVAARTHNAFLTKPHLCSGCSVCVVTNGNAEFQTWSVDLMQLMSSPHVTKRERIVDRKQDTTPPF